MSEAPFQTNTHLSLKKRKKRETQYHIKASNHLFMEQKNPKKKKKSKNPKTQNVFPDKNSYPLSLQILLCSFKHTGWPWVATKTLKPKSVLPIKIQTHSDHRFFAVPSNLRSSEDLYGRPSPSHARLRQSSHIVMQRNGRKKKLETAIQRRIVRLKVSLLSFFHFLLIFFLRMFVSLKHAILICVYMDLHWRGGIVGESELSIWHILLPSLYR